MNALAEVFEENNRVNAETKRLANPIVPFASTEIEGQKNRVREEEVLENDRCSHQRIAQSMKSTMSVVGFQSRMAVLYPVEYPTHEQARPAWLDRYTQTMQQAEEQLTAAKERLREASKIVEEELANCKQETRNFLFKNAADEFKAKSYVLAEPSTFANKRYYESQTFAEGCTREEVANGTRRDIDKLTLPARTFRVIARELKQMDEKIAPNETIGAEDICNICFSENPDAVLHRFPESTENRIDADNGCRCKLRAFMHVECMLGLFYDEKSRAFRQRSRCPLCNAAIELDTDCYYLKSPPPAPVNVEFAAPMVVAPSSSSSSSVSKKRKRHASSTPHDSIAIESADGSQTKKL